MRNRNTRNGVLALVGLAALTVYILACSTSFSPDDTKVLYPAFDGPSGKLCMAVYNRETSRSETLFLPVDVGVGETNEVKAPLLRAQWLADGRRVLVAWGTDSDLAIALVPCGVRGSVKLFYGLSKGGDHLEPLMSAIPVAGKYAFIRESGKEVLRLDLETGAKVTHEFKEEKSDLSLFPAPADRGVFYVADRDPMVFGGLDPETFQMTPVMSVTNKTAEGSFFAYDAQGKRIALVEEGESGQRLVVLEGGKTVFSRLLGTKPDELTFGNGVFSPKGTALLAGYQLQDADKTNSSFGVIEIPLGGAPIQKTPLITGVNTTDGMMALYFQVGVSHDGKTAAVASTYLAFAAKDFKPEDCALFFVDLRDAKRKVTKVPIPLPAKLPSMN